MLGLGHWGKERGGGCGGGDCEVDMELNEMERGIMRRREVRWNGGGWEIVLYGILCEDFGDWGLVY